MKRTLILTLLSIILFLVACDGAELTPTPFPATWTPGPALSAQQSYAVEISELLVEPETYADAYVQVTGQYHKRPLLVCETESATHPSPATWEISDNSNLALGAGAFDDALRSLVPDGLTVTVAGYWQQWEGPIGCGKEADQQTIWFLEVTDIISPSPIVQVTLTPSPIGGAPIFSEDEVTPVGGMNPNDPAVPIPTQEDSLPELEVTRLPADATATAVSNENNPTATSTLISQGGDGSQNPTPTATLNNNGASSTNTAVPTTTSTSNATNGTQTATPLTTATSDGSSGTPTSTPPVIGQSTSTPTPQVEVIDSISTDELGFEYLFEGETHDWELSIFDSTQITVSLVADPTLNLGLEVLDEDGLTIISRNQASAGQIETIRSLSVHPNSEYTLRIFNSSNIEGNYILLVWGNEEDAVILDARDILTYGQLGSATIPEGGARHFWFFYGEADDVVTITTSTDPAHLMLVSMYDTEGDILETDVEELMWIEEEIADATLPSSGLYAVWVEEEIFETADYTITIAKQ